MDALKPYLNAHMEICEVNCVLLRDCCVIVPQELQSKVITMLHQTHHGIFRMKTMARLRNFFSYACSGQRQLSRLAGLGYG